MFVAGRIDRQNINAYLAEDGPLLVASFSGHGDKRELTPEAVLKMRFLLDRALQPVDDFNGFEWLDQFQTAAVRYQLNFCGYALALAQANYMPGFAGYMDEAQRRLIQKQANHRVWRYWRLENAWGNLRLDADPVARENIMFTGFCALQMSMYHAATGNNDFNSLGSFALVHPNGQKYCYDLPGLIAALEREWRRSSFGLIACEPNWIYPLCNTIGMAAIKREAPGFWAEIESLFRRRLDEEFVDMRGRLVPCRSRYTGMALPPIGGAMPQALPCFFMNATMPDIAWRQWLRLRRQIMSGGCLQRKRFWSIDTGNYGFSRAAAYAVTATAATELGDAEVAGACLTALNDECPVISEEGNYYRSRSSVWAHATEFMAHGNVKGGFARVMGGNVFDRSQPYVHSASYPGLLMAAARYEGGVLQAVVYPGAGEGGGRMTVAGLIPHRSYQVTGAKEERIVADERGFSELHVRAAGRHVMEVREVV